MNIYKRIEALKRGHEECEDTWYSCPKSDEGCCNESQGEECTCGADYHNEKVDEILDYLNRLLK